MLKKLLVVLLIAAVWMLTFASAVTAEDAEKPIQVYFDGESMSFYEPPFIEKGYTLVPFRAVFQKLGYAISWDAAAKKVTGSKPDLTIELTVGSDIALVNGVEQQMPVKPVMKNNTTFVPLRFVIEHSEKDVSWDSYTRSIYIADLTDQLMALFERHYTYFKQKDLPGVLSTIDRASPAYDETRRSLEYSFAANDLALDVTFEVLEATDNQAIVVTDQLTQRLSGEPFQDTRVIALNRVVKSGGGWVIHASRVEYIELIQEDGVERGEVTLSEADQSEIGELVRASASHLEDEDIEAERALYMADYPNLEQDLAQNEQLLAVYDFRTVVGEIEILQGAADEAWVKYAVLITRVAGPAYSDHVQTVISRVKKDIDGKWKFAETALFSLDYRSDSVVGFAADE